VQASSGGVGSMLGHRPSACQRWQADLVGRPSQGCAWRPGGRDESPPPHSCATEPDRDVRGSAEYRMEAAATLCARTLAKAIDHTKGARHMDKAAQHADLTAFHPEWPDCRGSRPIPGERLSHALRERPGARKDVKIGCQRGRCGALPPCWSTARRSAALPDARATGGRD